MALVHRGHHDLYALCVHQSCSGHSKYIMTLSFANNFFSLPTCKINNTKSKHITLNLMNVQYRMKKKITKQLTEVYSLASKIMQVIIHLMVLLVMFPLLQNVFHTQYQKTSLLLVLFSNNCNKMYYNHGFKILLVLEKCIFISDFHHSTVFFKHLIPL